MGANLTTGEILLACDAILGNPAKHGCQHETLQQKIPPICQNIARIVKTTLHKLPGNSSLNVSFVCPVCPITPRLNLQVLELCLDR